MFGSLRIAVVAAVPFAFLFAADGAADPVQLQPLFRTGVYSDNIGVANLVVRDMTGDGIADVVSCSAGSAFIMAKDGAGLSPVWFSEPRGCLGVAAGDTDGDGNPNVVVAGGTQSSGTIYVYDPRSLANTPGVITVPGTLMVSDVAVGDADQDGHLDIVAVTTGAAYVYDAKTLALEWSAPGKGGNKVRLGDLEGDGVPEIIVNGSTGHILDSRARTEKWGYVGGFGRSMDVGDIDADGKAEIVYLSGYQDAVIIDGDTFATTTVHLPAAADAIAVGDANGDGALEILSGNNQWGSVYGVRPSDGATLWSISSPEHGTMAVATGDVTGDGSRDVVWGSGWTSSGADVLLVGNPNTKTVTWRSPDLDPSFGGTIADLDGDGKLELVTKTTRSESGYDSGVVMIFDLETHVLKSTFKMSSSYWFDIADIAVAQLDNDPALEIVLLGDSSYNPNLIVLDGVTGVQQYISPTPAYNAPYFSGALAISNVDGDRTDEIVVSTSDSHVLVLNGASSVIQWDSGALDGFIRDIAVADIDGRGGKEYLVATTAGFYVFNATTGAQLQHVSANGGFSKVAAIPGRYAVAGYYDNSIQVYSGQRELVWSCTIPSTNGTSALAFTSSGGVPQLAVGDSTGNVRFYPVADGLACPTPALVNLGTDAINDLVSVDGAGDARPRLVVSRNYDVEVDAIGATPCSGAGCPAFTLDSTSRGAGGLMLQGTYSGAAAIASVRWATTGVTFASGTGTGSGTSWSAGPIATPAGTSNLTIVVTDANGDSATRTVSMTTQNAVPVAPPAETPAPARRRPSH